jgi:ferrochelatase
MSWGVLLLAHGTVDALSDLPAFLRNIRRGHEAPAELVAEVTRRYAAIGGQSPLNRIQQEVAARVGQKLGKPAVAANRLWHPDTAEGLALLAERGVNHVVMVPMAQHSSWVYAEATEKAVAERVAAGQTMTVSCLANWGSHPGLTAAFAKRVDATLSTLQSVGRTRVLFSAHSLPVSVVRSGDPYETEFRASVEAVVAAMKVRDVSHRVVFQSQGMGTGPGGRPMEWLGPGIVDALDEARRDGIETLVIAPIGFLADHVEILYDLDIEAKGWARDRGIELVRTPSLNADSDLIDVVCELAIRGSEPVKSGESESR